MLNQRLKLVRDTVFIGSQEDFANTLGWPVSRVKDLERGKVKELKGSEAAELEDKFQVNGWWLLTGRGEMFTFNTANYTPVLMQTIEDALSEMEEFELVEYLKEKTVEKIVEKLSMPTSLLGKAFNFLVYERPLIFIYMVTKNMQEYDASTGLSHKEWLVKSFQNLDLLSLQNILGPAFNTYSKNHMLRRIEDDLSEEECRILLENIPHLQKHLKKNTSILAIGKKRVGF